MAEGMLDARMLEETVDIMGVAVGRGVAVDAIVNNRAGGNAPLISRELTRRFKEEQAGTA